MLKALKVISESETVILYIQYLQDQDMERPCLVDSRRISVFIFTLSFFFVLFLFNDYWNQTSAEFQL